MALQPVHIFLHSVSQNQAPCSRCGLISNEWDIDFCVPVEMPLLVQPSALLALCATAAALTLSLSFQDPQVPFHRAAPQTGGSQPVLRS